MTYGWDFPLLVLAKCGEDDARAFQIGEQQKVIGSRPLYETASSYATIIEATSLSNSAIQRLTYVCRVMAMPANSRSKRMGNLSLMAVNV
jgi:hypothetical protein